MPLSPSTRQVSLRRSMSARRATPSASAESLGDTTSQRTGARVLEEGRKNSLPDRDRHRCVREGGTCGQVRDAGRVRLQYVDR
jgi:hypothetical protein